MTLDTIIVGGGPAGLSAALVLGRARRRVVVFDVGEPRNHWSAAMHAYLTRDGLSPAEFIRISREQLQPYSSVELRNGEVVDAEVRADGFTVVLEGGLRLDSRTLLLATGVIDDVPVIDGIERFYGRTVHHCPYCDGWEHRDSAIAVYGCGDATAKYALAMTSWTQDIVLCTNGFHGMADDQVDRLAEHGIAIHTERIVRLEGEGDRLERIILADAPPLARSAMFFHTGQRQRSGLPAKLGCQFTAAGTVDTGRAEETDVPGLFVAGDASRESQLVIVAAAEGAQAAVAINTMLTRLDLSAATQSRLTRAR
ncbi:MAG: NAD(P)/FAD-dependent oxidoreductase [Gemmatimonadota bacterium]